MEQAILAQRSPAHPSENPGAVWEEAMRRGDFTAAWAVNDRVLAARNPAQRDDPSMPYHLRWVWDGRPFDAKHVLVRCYHGLGDTIQFCRYLAPLRQRVRSLTLEAQPELLPLLAELPGPDRTLPFQLDAPAPPSECDLEIMELAHALRLQPDPEPYLRRSVRTAAGGRQLRVGLCWRAGDWSPGRSVRLPLLAGLGRVPGVTLFSLQRGPGAADVAAKGAPAFANPDDRSLAVLDTARLLSELDLVISVDTMVAHLAGAMGIRTWLLLMAEPDWRWRAGGRGSVWYGSVRKYQQHRHGDWTHPLAELAADLTRLALDHSLQGTENPSTDF